MYAVDGLRGQTSQDGVEVVERVEAVEFGGSDEGITDGGVFCTAC